MEAATVRRSGSAESGLRRAGRRVLNGALNVYAALALIYLLVPVAIILLFSFNDTRSRFNFVWQGFTLEHWKDPFKYRDLTDALVTSIQVAALTTVIATFLGTLMALALVRYAFRGRSSTNLFIFIPLATPEVVLGASLLSLFISVGFARGFLTILIAHVMFSVSFVVVTVRSRLIGFDRSIEEAAQDLGANGIQTFFLVTLPLIAPAVIAAGLLTFIPAAGDFVNAELLGTPQTTMIGNVIQSRYLEITDYPTAAALSFILMLLILGVVLAYARFVGTEALTGAEEEPA